MDNVDESFIKTVYVTATNLNEVIFTMEVDDRYLDKHDEFKDLESGLEFIVVDRPYHTLQGRWEIRCKLLTKVNALRFLRNKVNEELYEPGFVIYKKKAEDERTED